MKCRKGLRAITHMGNIILLHEAAKTGVDRVKVEERSAVIKICQRGIFWRFGFRLFGIYKIFFFQIRYSKGKSRKCESGQRQNFKRPEKFPVEIAFKMKGKPETEVNFREMGNGKSNMKQISDGRKSELAVFLTVCVHWGFQVLPYLFSRTEALKIGTACIFNEISFSWSRLQPTRGILKLGHTFETFFKVLEKRSPPVLFWIPHNLFKNSIEKKRYKKVNCRSPRQSISNQNNNLFYNVPSTRF